MKIEYQVCTFEQAKELKELGIIQNSMFFYNGKKEELVYMINTLSSYSAFTISELGQMLNSETYTCREGSVESKFANWQWTDEGNQLAMGMFATEVEARADMLITLLKTDMILINVCNERLSE